MDFQSALVGQLDPIKRRLPDPMGGALQTDDPGVPGAGGGFFPLGGNTGINGSGTEVAQGRAAQPDRTNIDPGPGVTGAPGSAVDAVQAALQTPGTGPSVPSASTAPDYTQLGKYSNKMGAWSTDAANPSEKFARPWDQRSERYKDLTVRSHFDPNEGITPELLAALNGANIHGAKYSGSRDKLNVTNAGGHERYGNGGVGDIIPGFNDPTNTDKQWGAWSDDDAPPADDGGGVAQAPGMFAGSSISPALQGDAQGNIQSALGKLSAPSDLLQQLLAQLQGGQ